MTAITVIWGVIRATQERLCYWRASEVPREGEILKIDGKRYSIQEVEWSPPAEPGLDATAVLTVLSVP